MISVRSEVQILPGPPSSDRRRAEGSQGRPAAAPYGASQNPKRGHSSVGRAVALQASGRRFDPVWLHQIRKVFKFVSSETMVTLLFVIVKRECIRELLILQHAECPTPSAFVKSGTFGKHNGLSDHMFSELISRTSIMRTIKCLKSIRWMPWR